MFVCFWQIWKICEYIFRPTLAPLLNFCTQLVSGLIQPFPGLIPLLFKFVDCTGRFACCASRLHTRSLCCLVPALCMALSTPCLVDLGGERASPDILLPFFFLIGESRPTLLFLSDLYPPRKSGAVVPLPTPLYPNIRILVPRIIEGVSIYPDISLYLSKIYRFVRADVLWALRLVHGKQLSLRFPLPPPEIPAA